MAKTIEQLRKEIAEEEKRIAGEKLVSQKEEERINLQRQLNQLQNRKLISAGSKAKKLSKRFGTGLLEAGKKAAPILKKQARLIREQQLRDDAIARKLAKRKPKTKQRKRKKESLKSTENSSGFSELGNLGNLGF